MVTGVRACLSVDGEAVVRATWMMVLTVKLTSHLTMKKIKVDG